VRSDEFSGPVSARGKYCGPPLTRDILHRRFIFFPLCLCARYMFSLSLSLSLALSYLSASPFRQRDIISSWLLAHRRTTDNSAKLRAGCLIARHSGSANSRCIRRSRNSAAAGYLLNPLLHRFAKPVRIPDKVHWTVARISITIAHREMESLFHRLFSLALSLSLSLSLFFFLSTLAARQSTDLR